MRPRRCASEKSQVEERRRIVEKNVRRNGEQVTFMEDLKGRVLHISSHLIFITDCTVHKLAQIQWAHNFLQ